MSAEEYLHRVAEANPKLFAAEKLTITPAALREAMRRAFVAGREQGAEGEDRKSPSLPPGFEALFGWR